MSDDMTAVGTWDRYLTDAPDPNASSGRQNFRRYAQLRAKLAGVTVDEWIDRTYPPEHRAFIRSQVSRKATVHAD